jgi:hypothetical protein
VSLVCCSCTERERTIEQRLAKRFLAPSLELGNEYVACFILVLPAAALVTAAAI